MMVPQSRHMDELEREDILRTIAHNGIGGTRLYLNGEPLSVFPDVFNSFVLWGCPADDPTAQAAYETLKAMGMEVTVEEMQMDRFPGMKALKAISTYGTFRHTFLDQITVRGNATF